MNSLKKYAEIKISISQLEEKLKELKPQVLEILEKEKNIKTDLGQFALTTLTRWTYTDKIKTLNEAVKIAKIEEEEKGLATAEISQSIRFVTNKNETA